MKKILKKSIFVKEIVRAFRNYYIPDWKKIKNISDILSIKNESVDQKILIATGGGGYAAAKQIESLLAAALTLRGAKVEVLLCDGILPACFQATIDWDSDEKKFSESGTSRLNCATCFSGAQRTFNNIGISIIKLSNLISEEEKKKLQSFSESIDVDLIKNYSVDEVCLGEHALAGTLRYYAKANLDDNYSQKVLRRYFNAALITHYACKNLFKKNFYHSLVLHHGIYVPQGIIADTAIQFGIPTSTWHTAYRKQCLIFSHNGTYHKTLLNEPKNDWNDFEFTEQKKKKIENYLSSRWLGNEDQISFSKSLKSKSFPIKINKEIPAVLLLTNVLWDAQLHYPNNAFKSMMEWIFYTINYFINRKDLQLIIRVHPAELTGTLPSRQKVEDEIKKKYKFLPENIVIIGPDKSNNTYELAKLCDSSIIYATKAGVELSSMGIITVVAGEAWIRGKQFAFDVNSSDEYLKVLQRMPFKEKLSEEKKNLALKYAYHFFFRRMIFINSINYVKKHNVFEYSIKDIKELQPGIDKGLDLICSGILSKKNYIVDDNI